MVTPKQTLRYYKKRKGIPKVIYNQIDNEIIYGGKAVNIRVKRELKRPTEDWDLYAKKAKQEAIKTERALDKHMNFNAFETVPGIHPGTFRVTSRATGKVRADYTRPENSIPYDTISGKKYIKLQAMKEQLKKTLKDPTQKFIHAKLRDNLNRIILHERMVKARKAKAKLKQIRRKPIGLWG